MIFFDTYIPISSNLLFANLIFSAPLINIGGIFLLPLYEGDSPIPENVLFFISTFSQTFNNIAELPGQIILFPEKIILSAASAFPMTPGALNITAAGSLLPPPIAHSINELLNILRFFDVTASPQKPGCPPVVNPGPRHLLMILFSISVSSLCRRIPLASEPVNLQFFMTALLPVVELTEKNEFDTL